MSKNNETNLLEFRACINLSLIDRGYRLYVKEGKPIRMMSETKYVAITLYPENCAFESELRIFIGMLCEYKNLKQLKRLHDALEEGKWKEYVRERIDRIINYFEKGLAILKS